MASVNKVIWSATWGATPKSATCQRGAGRQHHHCHQQQYKNKTGEMVEEDEGTASPSSQAAEIVGQYLKKGRSVYVEGRIKTRKYTDKDGIEKYATDIIANEMQMLGGREGMGEPAGDDGGGYDSAPPRRAPAAAPRAAAAPAARQAPAPRPASGFDDMDDDIPF